MLTVLVDTGAALTFCITKTGLDKVHAGAATATLPPKRVLLKFGSATDAVREMGTEWVSPWFDFVFGHTLLSELQAVIDYRDMTMTLNLEGRRYWLPIFNR